MKRGRAGGPGCSTPTVLGRGGGEDADPCAHGGHREKTAGCPPVPHQPGREASEDTSPADTSTVDFQPPALRENKFPLFPRLRLWFSFGPLHGHGSQLCLSSFLFLLSLFLLSSHVTLLPCSRLPRVFLEIPAAKPLLVPLPKGHDSESSSGPSPQDF